MSADQRSRAFIGPRPVPPSAGVALSAGHLSRVVEEQPDIAWFELHAGELLSADLPGSELRRIAAQYPLSLHGPGLSLASVSLAQDPRLERLEALVRALHPDLISEELSFSDGGETPGVFPYTGRALGLVIGNIHRVQEALQRRLLIKTPLRTPPVRQSTVSAAEFLSELMLRTGCGVLLDLDGVRQSAAVSGRSPLTALHELLGEISSDDIAEIHVPARALPSKLNGSTPAEAAPGSDPELRELLEAAVARRGPTPTLIEWTDDAPAFEVLRTQAAAVQSILSRCASSRHRACAG
jgi:uncharacterized protein